MESGRLVNLRISTEFMGVNESPDPPELAPEDSTSLLTGSGHRVFPPSVVLGMILSDLLGDKGRGGLFGLFGRSGA